MQRFKMFSGVIGICEACADPLQHYNEFMHYATQLQSVMIRRMFVFEPNENDYFLEEQAPNMIPFYPN
jgi:hypothetical protein